MTDHLSADEYLMMQGRPPVGKPKPPKISERVFQRHCINALGLLGYLTPRQHLALGNTPDIKHGIVWQTADAKGNRNDAGIPDIEIKPKGRWGIVGFELKRPNQRMKLSKEQKFAAGCGAYHVVNDLDELLRLVAEAEKE